MGASKNENAGIIAYEINDPYQYTMIKKGKKCYNLNQCKLWKHSHQKIDDFQVLPKSNYQSSMFGGSQNYVEFEMPRLERHAYYKFVLNYTITNTSSTDAAWLLLSPLHIDHITMLVNSNAMGSDVTDQHILWHNLNEYQSIDGKSYDNYNYSTYNNLKCKSIDWTNVLGYNGWGCSLTGITLNALSNHTYKIELPLSLQKSEILSSSIKDNLVIRIYFKKSISETKIVGNGNQVLDTQLLMSDLKLYLRCKELTNNQLSTLYKQPKINHKFTKWVHNKYVVNQLIAGQEQSVLLSGYNSICSGMFVYFSSPNEMNPVVNNVNTTLPLPYHYQFQMNKVYLTNSVGVNLCNSNQFDFTYNNYLLEQNFPEFSKVLNKLSYGGFNNGLSLIHI